MHLISKHIVAEFMSPTVFELLKRATAMHTQS